MGQEGFEPSRLSTLIPKTSAATITPPAHNLVGKTGVEPVSLATANFKSAGFTNFPTLPLKSLILHTKSTSMYRGKPFKLDIVVAEITPSRPVPLSDYPRIATP